MPFRKGPQSETQKNLVIAAQMRARGATWPEIAKHFGRSTEAIRNWLKRHRAMWQSAQDGAMERAAVEVAELAGTAAIIRIPTEFTRAAENADAWMQETEGEPLFPSPRGADVANGGELTLPAFVEDYMVPFCLTDAAPDTIALYRKVSRRFARLMGNPRLKDVTSPTLAIYRDLLLATIGRGKSTTLSVNYVRTELAHVMHILNRAGPAVARRRDAAGFIKSPPWIRLPREQLGEPRTIPDNVLNRVYEAADGMIVPDLKGVSPAAWWRALLMVGRYLGLRARTVLSMTFECLDWQKRRLLLPASMMKGRRALSLQLPPVVYDHLKAFETKRELVFEYSASREMYRRDFHRLQTLAGLLPHQCFQLHVLRKTCLTRLYAIDPKAAQLLAGHSSSLITKMYYVATGEAIADSLNASAALPFTIAK